MGKNKIIPVILGGILSALLCWLAFRHERPEGVFLPFCFLFLWAVILAALRCAAVFRRDKNQLRPGNWALVGVFLLVLFGSGFPLAEEAPVVMVEENRLAAAKPAFSLGALDSYPTEYEAYYNDAFPLRQTYVNLYSNIKYYPLCDNYTGISLVGKDRWIFYTPTTPDYKSFSLYTEGELASLQNYLDAMHFEANSRGASLYVFLAPNKNEIYPEQMPARVQRSGGPTQLEHVEAHLAGNPFIPYISLKNALWEQKGKTPELYSPNGTHWNSAGAYFAYREVMKRIALDHPGVHILTLDDLTLAPSTVPETLNERRQHTDIPRNMDYEYRIDTYRETELPLPFENRPNLSVTQTQSLRPDALDKNVLIVHDSFGGYMKQYFASSFRQATFCTDGYAFKEYFDLAEIGEGDILLFELVSRDVVNYTSG